MLVFLGDNERTQQFRDEAGLSQRYSSFYYIRVGEMLKIYTKNLS